MIKLTCPGCESTFKAPEKAIGRRIKCPKCSAEIKVVAPKLKAASQQSQQKEQTATKKQKAAQAKPAEKAKLTIERVLSEFQGPIKPVRTSLTYHLSLLISLVTMLVLPLIYLGIVCLACYAVYYHAVNHTVIFESVRGRAAAYAFLLYAAPLVVGPVVVLFMFKPLLARPSTHQRSRSIKREFEPVLFAFVDKICETVHAPKPRRIEIDCQVNASASFRRGLWSMLGNDLVLTIGLPLVAGLSVREFGGVLAHEFGHFSQGFGMRLTFLVRSLTHWFVRVVYERDQWDEWLQDTAGSVDFRIGWILYLAMLAVWITRKILWLLLHVGMLVAGFTLRQMEYDADLHETHFAGSKAFASTAKRLQQLGAGFQMAQQQLGGAHQEGGLVDDLPKLVSLNTSRLSDRVQKMIDDDMQHSKTDWFDTHPCDRDRIAHAEAVQSAGVFHLEIPATELFSDFSAQSKATTWELYRLLFGNQIERSSLQPVKELVASHDKEQENYEKVTSYSQGTIWAYRPLKINSSFLGEPENAREVANRLKAARAAFEQGAPAARESLEHYEKHQERLTKALVFDALLSAKLRIDKNSVEPEFQTREGTRKVQQQSQQRMRQIDSLLEDNDKQLSQRLLAAFELLNVSQVASKIDPDHKLGKQSQACLSALVAVDGLMHSINQMACEQVKLGSLVRQAQEGADENLVSAIGATVKRVHPKMTMVHDVLDNTPYPFKSNTADKTLGSYVLPSVPSSQDLGMVIDALPQLLDNIISARMRSIAELIAIAEKVEKALGLSPLPKLPEDFNQ